ncbi:DUF5818 domain-containing protein [Sphingobium sufflavum]|uniref:DUF5818 domain-containing protein n=1 Tax=Sphingobium sufflavum TaxID=1129547 RepID=UPI001F2B2522|nr:DUF5818 domain-containing protein [Sphingobium sufflavum]MCE7795468.1 DUF5818 domain-containing protein [Sphingobium sufflavum]
MSTGHPVTATGLLVREGGGFALQRDGGGRVRLDLLRTPVDHVEKRVRVTGVQVADDLVEVETILPIDR